METDVGFSSFLLGTLHTHPKNTKTIILHRWDEWVPVSRLLKMTETNVALQKSLQHTNIPSAHGGVASAKINPKSAGTNKDSISTRAGARKDGTRGTKRGREDVRLPPFFFFFWDLGY